MNKKSSSSSRKRRRLLITGVPPQAVLERATVAFEVSVWRELAPIGRALIEAAAGQDAVIVMPGDRVDAALVNQLPASVQVLGTPSRGAA